MNIFPAVFQSASERMIVLKDVTWMDVSFLNDIISKNLYHLEKAIPDRKGKFIDSVS